MLSSFLIEHRDTILTRCKDKIAATVVPHPTTAELSQGAPVFLEQMVAILRREEGEPTNGGHKNSGKSGAGQPQGNGKTAVGSSAAHHGRQLLKLGFTLSQVVHGYGALCQVITGLLDELGVTVAAREYQTLNLCLDDAIAEAVTAYESQADANTSRRELQHLGTLAHELRDALASAMTTSALILSGKVALNGSTASVLGRAHARMRNLIDRSLAEVRLRADLERRREDVRIAEMFDDIITTASIEARSRGIELHVRADSALSLKADRQLLFSAVANLVHNAIKFSSPGGHVHLSGAISGDSVQIDVEDQCGGIPADKLTHVFEPYVQTSVDRSGLGLGLPIVRRAVHLQGGTIEAKNIEGKGCIFTIRLPRGASVSELATATR
jgi:signal transduction histidine kinase